MNERVRRLRAVPHWQFGRRVQLTRLAGAGDQLVDRDLAEDVPRPLRAAHVALDHAAIGAADLRDRLAGLEVDHIVHVHAGVRLTPSKHRKLQHVGFKKDIAWPRCDPP